MACDHLFLGKLNFIKYAHKQVFCVYVRFPSAFLSLVSFDIPFSVFSFADCSYKLSNIFSVIEFRNEIQIARLRARSTQL